MAILLTAAVFIFLEISLSDLTGRENLPGDKTTACVVGMVWQKEVRRDFGGGYLPVIYILPKNETNNDYCLIQCYLDSWDHLPSIGECVEVSGRVKVFSSPTNPGEFDSRLYYSTLKISYRLTGGEVLKKGGKPDAYREGLYRIRVFLENALDRVLTPEDAGIMKAMLLGDKAFMDEEVKELYKNNGIMHILAVSGLHISIIGMGVYELLRRLALWGVSRVVRLQSLKTAGTVEATRRYEILNRFPYIGFDRLFTGVVPVLVAIAFMYSYGIMCGMGTSSFRAICMFVLRLLAPVVGRTYDVLSALSLAEILLLLDQPLYLYNSGFLFSFGAVLGISAVKPYLALSRKLLRMDDEMKFVEEEKGTFLSKKLLDVKGWIMALKEGALVSVSVMLVTLPVYACFYYTYPLHSLVLNLLVIPVMGALMLLGIAAMLLGCGVMPLAKIPGSLVHVILSFYKWLCSGSMLRSGFTWYMGHSEKWQVTIYVAVMALFVISSWLLTLECSQERFAAILNRRRMDYKIRKRVLVLIDAGRAFLILSAVFLLTFRISPDLEINMIDVGQGDGIVVSSGTRHMLIDGGSTSKKNVGKYQIIPFLKYKGIGKLDVVVMTHEDQDHISGMLEIMDDMEKGGIRIKSLLLPEVADSSRGGNYRLLEDRARELGIPIAYINEGESFCLGKASFTCLNPELNMVSDGANAYSTVLFMEYPVEGSKMAAGNNGNGERGEGNSTRRFTALFTGDVEENGQEYLKSVIEKNPEKYEDLSLLKVAHHGSQYTTDEEFLELTHPRIALISCGLNNSYGHPHQELLDRLDQASTTVYRTDIGGCIRVTLGGDRLSISQYVQ